jgi:clan AA aspartic protease (TIGR02281 family)
MAAALALPSVAVADIYRWTDELGAVHFSDTPDRSAHNLKKVNDGHINVIKNPEINIARLNQQVPFKEVNGNMVVRGSVNGTPMNFIVDTGASLVVIPPTVAKSAGIETSGVPQVRLETANGRVQAPAVQIGRLDVASFSLKQVRAAVVRVSPDAYTGLLGMSFLSHYRMQVDHQHHMLILEQRP